MWGCGSRVSSRSVQLLCMAIMLMRAPMKSLFLFVPGIQSVEKNPKAVPYIGFHFAPRVTLLALASGQRYRLHRGQRHLHTSLCLPYSLNGRHPASGDLPPLTIMNEQAVDRDVLTAIDQSAPQGKMDQEKPDTKAESDAVVGAREWRCGCCCQLRAHGHAATCSPSCQTPSQHCLRARGSQAAACRRFQWSRPRLSC
jgi:hypothetical protein